MQSLSGGPGVRNDGGGRPLLSLPEPITDEGMMPRLLRAAGMLRGDQPDKGHGPRRTPKSARVAELGGDGQRGQVINPAEAAQPLDATVRR